MEVFWNKKAQNNFCKKDKLLIKLFFFEVCFGFVSCPFSTKTASQFDYFILTVEYA